MSIEYDEEYQFWRLRMDGVTVHRFEGAPL